MPLITLPVSRLALLLQVLNKVDMVPREAVLGWLRALRQHFPVVAFKSNTSEGGGKLGRSGGFATKVSAGVLLLSDRGVVLQE